MSTKAIVWIIIILLVILGVWYFWSAQNSPLPASEQTSGISQTTSGESQGSSEQNISSGDSNADLTADLNAIDSQTNAANSDSASVDQSFNDQPVQQTE